METEGKKKKNKNNTKNSGRFIDYFYSTESTNFINLLKTTSKLGELYESSEAKLAIILSIIISIIFYYIFNSVDIETFNQIIRALTSNVFSALMGMLGFAISGLAILTGTITNKVINKIDEEKMITNLISILYSFYFIGAFLGVAIISFIIMYLMSFPQIVATRYSIVIISFVLSYLFCFSIFYSIGLLGTCLRIFLISYKFTEDKKTKNL